MKRLRKAFGVLLTLALLVGLLPTSAIAYRKNNYPLTGSGSVNDPFLIGSEDDWNAFALEKLYQDNGWAYDSCTLYYKLVADITVSRSVSWDFNQFFDGGGHTITFNVDDAPRTCAPFLYAASGAVIENLTVSGTIRTANQFAAGFVAETASGGLTIRNCTSDIVIESSVDGDGTHGGFVGRALEGSNADITIDNCVFSGQIKGPGTTSCGGFVGWLCSSATLTVRDSLFLPSGDASDDVSGSESAVIARFNREAYTQPSISVSNAYYSRALGETDDSAPVYASRPSDVLSGPVRNVGGTTWYAAADVGGIEISYTYTGSPIVVEPVVTFNGETLTKDTDYSVSFLFEGAAAAGVNAVGNYTAVVTGMGDDYAGITEVPFRVMEVRRVSTWAQLHDELEVPTDVPIELTTDIAAADTDEPLVFNAPGYSVALDLNGHTIDLGFKELSYGWQAVLTVEGGTLTVLDSSGDDSGMITGGNNGICIERSGVFVLESGSVSGTNGGVSNGGTFEMNGGKITGNTSTMSGGGVSNGGTFEMNGGEISGNTAHGDGGGVSNSNTSTFTMTGGKISGNTSLGKGGGVYNEAGQYLSSIQPYQFPAAEFIMTGGEISGNTADAGGGVYNGAGDEDWKCGVIRLSGNPVITGNLVRGKANNVFLAWVSYVNPYDPETPVDMSSWITVDGTLASSARIGVTTQREPVAGSPSVFSDALPRESDLARFSSDDGSYQVILTGGKAALGSSSQSAWEDLKAAMAEGGTIVLTKDVVYGGSNAAATEALTVPAGKTVVLDLNGYTVDRKLGQSGDYASAFDPVIVVEAGGKLTIRDNSTGKTGTVTGGSRSGIRNAGTLILQGGSVAGNGNYDGSEDNSPGGGIMNTGSLEIRGGFVKENRASSGGGIYNDGTLLISGGSVSDNSARGTNALQGRGGGVFNAAGGVAELSGGYISGNFSTLGGGVYNLGDFDMSGGQIGSNEAGGVLFWGDYSGGGVYLESGVFAVSGGGISNNRASTGDGKVLGGGVFLEGGSLEVSGSVRITGNAEQVRSGNDDVRTADNVYLPGGNTISVSGALTGALIGVTTEKKPTAGHPIVFTDGLQGNGDSGSFASDDALYAVETNDAGEAQLNADQTPYQITVLPADDGTVSASAPQAVETTIVTVSLQAKYGFRLVSLTVTTDDGAEVAVTLESTSPDPLGDISIYSFRMPAGNVTVAAVFRDISLDSYELIFYEDIAGTTVYRTMEVPYGASLAPYANTVLEKDNYTFLGWTTTKRTSEYNYKEALETSIFFRFDGTMTDERLELYPVLVKDRIQIRLHLRAFDGDGLSDMYEWYDGSAYDPGTPAYMGSGGDGKPQSRQFNVDWGEKIDMTAMDAAFRDGYTLDGWFTSGDVAWEADMGVDPQYGDKDSDGAFIRQTAEGLNYNYYILTLSAEWTPKTIDVVYEKGDHGLDDIAGDRVALGGTLKLPAKGPTPEDGYIFVGWQAADKTLYSAGADFLFTDWSLTEQEVLYFTAYYLEAAEPDAFLLLFDSAGGSFVTPVLAAEGEEVPAPADPSLEGSTFLGWFDGDTQVTFPYTMPAHDVTLTAHWETEGPAAERYLLSFDSAGGSFVKPVLAEEGEEVPAPADPSLEGSTFLGWFDGDAQVTFPYTMPAHDVTLTAHWDADSEDYYTIFFDTLGGTAIPEMHVKSGDRPVRPADPTKEHFRFIDWDPEFPEVMPDHDVTLTAVWEALEYTVTFDANGGTFRGQTGAKAKRITITDVYGAQITVPSLAPRSGYDFEGWTLNGKIVSPPSLMPDTNPVYVAKWTPQTPDPDPDPYIPPVVIKSLPFTDVPKDVWFFDAVYHCYEKGYLNGTDAKTFSPSDKMTRAMFATVLYRIAGEPAVTGTARFDDVDENAWYGKAVVWAAVNGILQGYGEGKFGTGDFVSREQILTVLWRLAGSPYAGDSGLSAFSDAGKISSWAKDAYQWALQVGILTGRDAGLADPQSPATRAEVAQIIQNYDNRSGS